MKVASLGPSTTRNPSSRRGARSSGVPPRVMMIARRFVCSMA